MLLQSLQRPRKITMRGTDGKAYTFLCKPSDDLRKDSRMQEFCAMVSALFKKDVQARRRQLRVRTYAVVPLNDECGLIEWVENTNVYRAIVTELYRRHNRHVRGSALKALMNPRAAENKGLTKVEIFERKVLPKFPAVFHEWFTTTFPDPAAWYSARTAYVRTAAVMSMVGYVVGLGDRHGENIMFDQTNGEAIHVDFNCLFLKGKLFKIPEVVPFRLTRNMVDAMGVSGVEGGFRQSCEVTLSVLRKESDALISVLRTFVFDPLVEWSEKRDKGGSNLDGDRCIEKCKDRLHGARGDLGGVRLSVAGCVDELIAEATDNKNLADMYIGWSAYL